MTEARLEIAAALLVNCTLAAETMLDMTTAPLLLLALAAMTRLVTAEARLVILGLSTRVSWAARLDTAAARLGNGAKAFAM